jgi:hypothetical protein
MKTKLNKTYLSPYGANTLDKVCRLGRDNFSAGEHWILTDGFTVSVTAQKAGSAPTRQVTIPRKEFNKLISWYIRPQKLRKV